jgi:hypothetical protein
LQIKKSIEIDNEEVAADIEVLRKDNYLIVEKGILMFYITGKNKKTKKMMYIWR